MVSTSMVYGCIIDVFNTENISAERFGGKAPGLPYVSFADGGYRDLRFVKAPG